MRKTKRILLKVEVALRCYSDRPLDASLLVFLAFQDETKTKIDPDFLPRSFLTREEGEKQMKHLNALERESGERYQSFIHELTRSIGSAGPELLKLPLDRYQFPDNNNYYDWAKAFSFLAPHYVPSHLDVLNAVASVVAPSV